ncbi:hypothetical protein, partial [Shimia sp.]|uniref:hypothetical protein n=1 Tax=Shimia sp. TaxID=1954381 RepID=UPI003B8C86D6
MTYAPMAKHQQNHAADVVHKSGARAACVGRSPKFAKPAFCALETCTTTEANGRFLPNQANLGFRP